MAAGGCELRGDRRLRVVPPALVICSSCLVQAACLAYALDHHIEHGIWGGRTSGQRAQLIPKETP